MAEISMELIKKLREWSGAGIMDCKGALQEAEGDIEKAMEILRKRRTDIAANKAHRETKNGMVGAAVNQRTGVVFEVNVETDFAARSDVFKGFVKEMGQYLLGAPVASIAGLVEAEATVAMVKDTAGKIGENTSLRRFVRFDVDGCGLVHHYLHTRDVGGVPSLGVLVEIKTQTDAGAENPMVREFANNLCLHAAAAAPRWLVPAEVPADVLEKEKDIYREQLKESGKPANMIEKIVEGKLTKFYAENCLMNQEYSLAQDKSEQKPMAVLLKELGGKVGEEIQVTRFVRMDLGGV